MSEAISRHWSRPLPHSEKINDPALVEKDYWIMHAVFGLKQLGLTFELKGGTSLSKGSRSLKRAVIDRVGCSTIPIPWQRSSSSIHSGIRICIPLGSATCTWCSPKEEHFRILVTVAP
jgi:hypothetical protein